MIEKLSVPYKWFNNGIPDAALFAHWQSANLDTKIMWPDTTGSIHYKLNSKGYRDKEWSEDILNNSVWCIGHSDVFGLGVDKEFIWPSLISFPTVNLGINGAAWDTISRIVSSGLSVYSPKSIVIQSTTKERKEYITKELQQIVLPSMPAHLLPHENIWRYEDDTTLDYLQEKNVALIRWACKAAGVPLLIFELPNRWDLIRQDPAVDQQHPGIKTHRMIAEWVNDQLSNINSN